MGTCYFIYGTVLFDGQPSFNSGHPVVDNTLQSMSHTVDNADCFQKHQQKALIVEDTVRQEPGLISNHCEQQLFFIQACMQGNR